MSLAKYGQDKGWVQFNEAPEMSRQLAAPFNPNRLAQIFFSMHTIKREKLFH